MADQTPLEQLKDLTDETADDPRLFTDDKLTAILSRHGDDIKAAAYEVLVRKSQSTTLTMAGTTLPDQQKYWLRRAAMVRPNRGGNAPRADDPEVEE